MILTFATIALAIIALSAAVFVANERDMDPIHRRQQRLLKDHHRAMRLWRKRAIKPLSWWKRLVSE